MNQRTLSPVAHMMKLAVAAGALLMTGTAAAQTSAPISACQLAADAESLIGKPVRARGYLVDLGAHGFVLLAEKSCEAKGLTLIDAARVHHEPAWRQAFDYDPNPREVILSGSFKWGKSELGAKVPIFDIASVESISSDEVPWSQIK